MVNFGLGMGAILALAGLATYFFAPRVGPNPLFGVRVGYAYASREVWDKTNRFGGALLALVGAVTALAGVILQALNIPQSQGMIVLTVVLMTLLLGATAWMFVYARNLARHTTSVREIAPVKFHWAYLAPALLTFALLVALTAYFYPHLPAQRMATHFNINEQPDGWMSRDTFIASYLGLAALFVALNILIVIVATREPMIAFGRWGKNWQLDPARGLIVTGFAFALMNGIFMITLWTTAWYNIYGTHAFPLSLLIWIIFPLIALIVILFFALGKRNPPTDR